ncbi:MAG: hypothetical protein WD607_04580 [Candidatus Paceibacterota bacterium]
MDNYNITEECSHSILGSSDDFSSYDPYESYKSSSVYIENKLNEELQDLFQELKAIWLHDTSFDSGYRNKINHSAYLKIISFGESIIPTLIDDMLNNNTYWHYALVDITGENPIKEESRGVANKIIEDWKKWATENNYV